MPFYGDIGGETPHTCVGKSISQFEREAGRQVGFTRVSYFEPRVLDTVTSPPNWQGDACIPQTVSEVSTGMWFVPPQPVSKDTFWQEVSQNHAIPVHGAAPTSGIYTGVKDVCTEGWQ